MELPEPVVVMALFSINPALVKTTFKLRKLVRPVKVGRVAAELIL